MIRYMIEVMLANLAVGMCLSARFRVILASLAVGMCLGARLRVED